MGALRGGPKMEVYIDGGYAKRDTCGFGNECSWNRRNFLYSLVYGQQGIGRAIDLIEEEFDIAMKLMGTCDTLGGISEKMLSWKDLASHTFECFFMLK
ncbi:hypothetical protein BJ742DRAFT_77033 [Cladochytrium replicatum]|nr:hypothetical protein BJ742DRAFT_77033 [Cladochytrium replicatum]